MDKLTGFTGYKTASNLDLYICKNPKFKTNLIELYLVHPLSREDASKTALLPYVLYRGSKKYPTSRDIERRLEELYGADLNVSVIKRGELQLIKFSLELVNEGFLPEKEPLLEEGLKLLYELVLNPLFEDKYVEQESEFLKKEIKSLVNDKYTYAIERCYQEMCKEEPFGIYKLGTLSGLEEITSEGLYQHYQKLIAQNQIYLLVVGAVDEKRLQERINEIFTFEHQQPGNFNQTRVRTGVDKVKEVVESLNVQQGKLSLGFRTGITRNSSQYYALMFYNGLLGAFPHSKLFQNVREKASLAYYANSRLESTKGLMQITSGIESINYDRAKEIILEQVDKLAQGEFNDDEFDWTRKALINHLKSSADNNRGLTGHYLLGLINGKPESIREMITELEKVKRDEIIEVARRIELDTIYFLDKK